MKKTFDKFESAQTICSQIYGYIHSSMIGGMNIRIEGGTFMDLREHYDHSDMYPYFNKADEMINEGRIFFVYPFKCERERCPTRFQYGGFWACNSCNTHINTPDWWKIKVTKDGNQYCCVGNGFTNLQESDNYAFGETFQIAIDNYRNVILKNQ